jgi:hypothetical protein
MFGVSIALAAWSMAIEMSKSFIGIPLQKKARRATRLSVLGMANPSRRYIHKLSRHIPHR